MHGNKDDILCCDGCIIQIISRQYFVIKYAKLPKPGAYMAQVIRENDQDGATNLQVKK